MAMTNMIKNTKGFNSLYVVCSLKDSASNYASVISV